MIRVNNKVEKNEKPAEITRTNIDTIAPLGYELSEEHLRLVSGSKPSAGTTSDVGATDDD